MSAISSPRNPRVVAAAKLHDARHRRAHGRTLVEGPGALEAANRGGAVVIEVFSVEDGPNMTLVTRSVMGRLAGTESPRGPVAVVAIPEPRRPRAADTLVLWEVADPGNVGALIRSAAFMGCDVAHHGGADVWSPKAIRAAAGAQFATHVSRIDSLDELPVASTVAAVAAGGVDPHSDIERPIGLVLGNEAAGLPDDIIDRVTHHMTIPGSFESLNVAVAGSLLMDRLLR